MTQVTAETNTATPWRQRMQLLLILGVAILTVLISYLMYFTGVGVPEQTKNKGILLSEPVYLGDLPLRDADRATLADASRKFRLIAVVDGACDATCTNLLYLGRQVHTLLASRAPLLDRLYINLGEPLPADQRALLENEYRLTVLSAERNVWQSRFAQSDNDLNIRGHQLVLVDRGNYAIIVYTPEHAGADMLDDIEFLLKTTL